MVFNDRPTPVRSRVFQRKIKGTTKGEACMAERGIFERPQEVSIDAEIWWDCSSLVCRSWARCVVEKADTKKKDLWQARIWNDESETGCFSCKRPRN